jgi:hypothetical protein
MRIARTAVTVGLILAFAAACTAPYKSKPELNYYHGQNVPGEYFKILKATPAEITFEIRIKFPEKKMYHLILDGNEPVAQGWYSTIRADSPSYTVTLKPEEGKTFEPGKTYRLCIGGQSPEAVQMTTRNYRCIVDHIFVFQEK